jgi:deferrochelatase/peroxidase EfeB
MTDRPDEQRRSDEQGRPDGERPGRLGRRAFLGSAALGAAALAAAGCTPGEEGASATGRRVPFLGPRQPGVDTPVARFGLLAAFNLVHDDRARLAKSLRELTHEAHGLMVARPPEQRDTAYPPTETGILGPGVRPEGLTVTVSVGASLFDDRFGLAELRPRELVKMPFLANDRLDPAQSHGDLLLALSAEQPDVLLHALRQLMRRTRDNLVLHWMVDGYNRPDAKPVPGRTDNRNLLGFKDGTANLDVTDRKLMDELVWVGGGDGEPAWAVGGSYQAVRIIRMFVEFWDRTPLNEQQKIIGRHKAGGAPLGRDREADDPGYADDPAGHRIPLDAHIRLANPRSPATDGSRILRRGFNFSRGFDDAGRLDQGLAFVSYQKSLEQGFLAVQARLSGEPLEEYILPVGGGFFYVLPGVTTEDAWLGQQLVA